MAMQLGSSGVKSDINVTPFVDIVLVLLIIFMVVTPLLSRTLDISVPPKAVATATEAVTTEQLIVTVKGPEFDPKILINQEDVTGGINGFKDRIAELLTGSREKVVFFQAENDLPYQYVVQVIDMIRGGGAKTIGLITEDKLDLAAGSSGEAAAAEPAPAPAQ